MQPSGVPSQPAQSEAVPQEASDAPARHHHTVQFYENEHFLTAAVSDFLAEGVSSDHVVIVIATPAHRHGFQLRLKSKGLDVDAAAHREQLIWVDARELLATFMVQSAPDPDRFNESVGALFERQPKSTRPAPVRAYGEMVDVLWKEGNIEGAIRLEELWNALQQTHRFSLLCAYAIGSFYKATDGDAFERICRQHTTVLPTERYLEGDEEARLREIGVLQQRARALETEIQHRNELEQRLRIALAGRIHAEDELKRALTERELLLERERVARTEAEAASRAKNDFLAVMSHELRTPLNAIGGHVQLLEMGIHGAVSEAQREAFLRIERSQRHLLALINDILNLTRIEAGQLQYAIEDVVLDHVVGEVKSMLDPLAQQRSLTLETSHSVPFGSQEISVRADREKVQQILLNLLSNSIKFTPSGGKLTLSTGVVSEVGPTAFVSVSDTGIGIDPLKLEVIFQPFVQLAARPATRKDGVGLGLSISRELARGMGGDLVAHSKPGEGATFTLTLPIA